MPLTTTCPVPKKDDQPQLAVAHAAFGRLEMARKIAVLAPGGPFTLNYTLDLIDDLRDVHEVFAIDGVAPTRLDEWERYFDDLEAELARKDQDLFWIGGDKWSPKLRHYPQGAGGLRAVREHVLHVPRGFRVTFLQGQTLAAFGGEHSLDRFESDRFVGTDEVLTFADLELLGHAPSDILLGHYAPLGVPAAEAMRFGEEKCHER